MKYVIVHDPDETVFERFKWTVKMRFQEAMEWVKEHREFVMVLTPIAIKGVTTVVKVVGRRANLKKEEDVKNLYCYDRSLGHYWSLRRELSNKEWLEIDKRKRAGEKLADILTEMRVLK